MHVNVLQSMLYVLWTRIDVNLAKKSEDSSYNKLYENSLKLSFRVLFFSPT